MRQRVSPIGIMQGRLVPPVENRFQCFPRENWRREFERARQAGLEAIEWIYDLFGADINPLGSDSGIAEMKALAGRHQVAIRSVCADYFMDRPFVRATPAEREERVQTLFWLLDRCGRCGIERVVLPFVDASKIETAADWEDVVTTLRRALPAAERAGVELHLETALAPGEFTRLLAHVPARRVKVNYDSGNSASLGYLPRDEFAAYGQRIGSVHVKDRVRGGGTVPLGTGSADLPALFACLEGIGYSGPLILQVARGQPGEEVAWAEQNRAFVLRCLDRRE